MQYPGARVTDRKARNDSLKVNWIAAGANNEFVQLDWDVPVDVRKVFLYNIKPNPLTNTNIQVTDCELFFYLQEVQAAHIPSTGIISVNGSEIDIPNLPKIDRMKVIVKSFTGLAGGQPNAGLAEVETNARISYYEIIGIKQISTIADRFSLMQNYPNPFNPATRIKYSISQVPYAPAVNVKLVVYDITGRVVTTLVNQLQTKGIYQYDFDASKYASGIFFYQLTAGGFSDVKKMILLK
jgi:hypothetical protein